MEKIRLGFEEFLEIQEQIIPAAWFFGRQGERPDFMCWSDSTYKAIKRGEYNDSVRAYHFESNTLNCLSFGEEKDSFEVGLYKNYISEGKSFLIPILITSSYPTRDLKYLNEAILPEDLRNYIKAGHATVLFYSHAEGNIDYRWFPILDAFCRNNGLNKNNVWLSISDLNKSKYPDENDRLYSIRLFSYFSEDLWFPGQGYLGPKKKMYEKNLARIERFREENRTIVKEKTFLCLNRRKMPHRTFLAGYFMSHPEVLEKSWLSLGTSAVDGFSKNRLYTGADALEVLSVFGEYFTPERRDVEKYYNDHLNDVVLRQLDLPDLTMSQNPLDLNEDLYRTSFVNIVSETYCDLRGYHFFTEKTFKSVYSMLPTVWLATPGSLKSFKNLGFGTFNNWWDESYDDIEDTQDRIAAVCRIVKDLSKKSKEELFRMTQEMEPILYYNAKKLIYFKDIESTLTFFRRIQKER